MTMLQRYDPANHQGISFISVPQANAVLEELEAAVGKPDWEAKIQNALNLACLWNDYNFYNLVGKHYIVLVQRRDSDANVAQIWEDLEQRWRDYPQSRSA